MKFLMAATTLFFILVSEASFAYTFDEAIKRIGQHETIQALQAKSSSLKHEAEAKSSWGDPVFKLAAKNLPVESLEDDKTPMTGFEIGVARKIPLSTKYSKKQEAFNQLSLAAKQESKDKQRQLTKSLWLNLIDTRKIRSEIKIYSENLAWMEKTLKVSKRLYSNGKISQQALLDIQIRKSEIESNLAARNFALKEQQQSLNYLINIEGELATETIPWSIIDAKKDDADFKEASLRSVVVSKETLAKASRLDLIPDLTLSFGYTKRSNIDNVGDFVAATVSMPLPLAGQKYSQNSKTKQDQIAAVKNLQAYLRYKQSELERLAHAKARVQKQLEILDTKTIEFAEGSREITSKSYSLGSSTYLELLQSELKLQKLKLKRVGLSAEITKYKISHKFLAGEKLYD